MTINSEEKQTVLAWNSSPNLVRQDTLPALFETQVERHGKRTALIFNDITVDYGAVNAKANQLAHYLRDLNGNHKTLIAICMKPSIELLISILGVLKAGCAYVPLDPSNPVQRQHLILEDTQAPILLTQTEEKALFTLFTNPKQESSQHTSRLKIVCVDTNTEFTQCSTKNLAHINRPSDLAYVIYTSGSTGTPKGVMITHRNVMHFIHWYSKALQVTAEDIFDFSSSISFDFAVANTLFPLMQGAAVAICPAAVNKDPFLWLDHLLQTKVSIIKITPSHFRYFKEAVLGTHYDLALRFIVFGGETLFAQDVRDWLARFPAHTLFCEYGPTEATVASSWIKVNNENITQFENKIPIGKPALNTHLYLLDENLDPIPPGGIGELYIGGAGVAHGYLHRPEVTKSKFVPNPFADNTELMYRTGDYCRLVHDGNFMFIERVDNQIKIRGFRIEIEEIENCLLRYPNITEAVVVAKPLQGQTEEKQLVAYYVTRNKSPVAIHMLRTYLHQHLPEYMVPTFFEALTALPLSANGKLNRQQLPAPKLAANAKDLIPEEQGACELKRIWEETLNITNIHATDNFFDLGGHSLTAARILSKIRQTYQKDISLQDFYAYPTIDALNKCIKEAPAFAASVHWLQTTAPLQVTQEPIPLNELQFVFWLFRLFYPTLTIANLIDRKRLMGTFDLARFNQAIASICTENPLLNYGIHHFKPLQHWQALTPPQIEPVSLVHLPPAEQEVTLLRSLHDLEKRRWPLGQHAFELRLFILSESCCELQLALSHTMGDEISLALFFKKLSTHYPKNSPTEGSPSSDYYKQYLLQYNQQLKAELPKNVQFWKNYSANAALVYFPDAHRSKEKSTQYLPIPPAVLEHLQSICTAHRLSITDNLCAAIGLTMAPYLVGSNKQIFVNFLKSTRENSIYDHIIGLFLRTDVIKIDVDNAPDFITLCQRVQHSILETAPYQRCANVIKLAFLVQKHWKGKKISTAVLDFVAKWYARLFAKFQLDFQVLQAFFRIFLTRKCPYFIVNINIMNNFFVNQVEKELLGLPVQPVKTPEGDKAVYKQIINIWFSRNSENKPQIILSGNLQAQFLKQVGEDILNILQHAGETLSCSS